MMKRDFIRLGAASALVGSIASSRATADAKQDGITVRWLGGATMEITVGSLHFLTDPCFGEGDNAFQMADPNENFDPVKGPSVRSHARLSPFPGLTVQDFDAVILSHAHEDHFDQVAQALIGSEVQTVCPSHDLQALVGKGFNAHGLAHGKSLTFQRGDARLEVAAIPAIHSPNPGIAEFLGEGNGYFLRATVAERTQHIYWAGDTFITEQVLDEMSRHPTPDLFIPHIGAVGRTGTLGQLSFNAVQAIEAAQILSAKRTLPIHHSTFSLYQEPVQAMIEAHRTTDAAGELNVLTEGEALSL